MSKLKQVRRGGELFSFSRKKRVTRNDFDSSPVVILIHGFTATGLYLSDLAEDLTHQGFSVMYYNYNSYQGIDKAAEGLFALLTLLDGVTQGHLSKNQISLVCHSMGGLVAKALCVKCNGTSFISKIVTLGTPHDGTLRNSRILDLYVSLGEELAGAGFRNGYYKKCLSAQQLTGKDMEDSAICLLDELKISINGMEDIPKKSISGGKDWLILGKNSVINYIANRYIQSVLGDVPNDGLVAETSSCWTTNWSGLDPLFIPEHLSNYPEYNDLNHSFLIKNQFVSLAVADFLS